MPLFGTIPPSDRNLIAENLRLQEENMRLQNLLFPIQPLPRGPYGPLPLYGPNGPLPLYGPNAIRNDNTRQGHIASQGHLSQRQIAQVVQGMCNQSVKNTY